MPRKAEALPDLQTLKSQLDYNCDTGEFVWRVKKSNRHAAGKAGYSRPTKHGLPYITIGIDGDVYMAHRLAYYYVTGNDPGDMLVDHINGDVTDNRFSNLRLATLTQNWANSKRMKNNTSGFKGVCWHKNYKKWMSRICSNGKRVTLGFYDTPEDAHAAYLKAANEHFGEYMRAG
jgi:hypothetical protein